MNNKHTLGEDAKTNWFKIVDTHTKKQKGLPALSTLNTDAGDVETGIEVFNNTVSSDAGCCTMSESLDNDWVKRFNFTDKWYKGNLVVSAIPGYPDATVVDNYHLEKVYPNGHIAKHIGNYKTKEAAFDAGNKLLKHNLSESVDDTVDIEYDDLCIVVDDPHDDGSHRWDKDICLEWTYKVSKEDVISFLYENCVTEEDNPNIYNISLEEGLDWVSDNFDEMFDKYNDAVKERFREAAQDDAYERYDPDDYVNWDIMPGGHDYDDPMSERVSDDNFDMSMRTLL